MVDFVDTNKTSSELKHVVPEGNDYKLCVLRPLFDVRSHNGHL